MCKVLEIFHCTLLVTTLQAFKAGNELLQISSKQIVT